MSRPSLVQLADELHPLLAPVDVVPVGAGERRPVALSLARACSRVDRARSSAASRPWSLMNVAHSTSVDHLVLGHHRHVLPPDEEVALLVAGGDAQIARRGLHPVR